MYDILLYKIKIKIKIKKIKRVTNDYMPHPKKKKKKDYMTYK